jgi:hypothetical protein
MQFRRSKCFYSVQSWIRQCAAGAEFCTLNAVGYRRIHQFTRLGKAYYSCETVHGFWVRDRVAGGTFLIGILLGLNTVNIVSMRFVWSSPGPYLPGFYLVPSCYPFCGSPLCLHLVCLVPTWSICGPFLTSIICAWPLFTQSWSAQSPLLVHTLSLHDLYGPGLPGHLQVLHGPSEFVC